MNTCRNPMLLNSRSCGVREFSVNMPEGPEIRRAADRISKVVVGRPLSGVRFLYPSIIEHQELIEGLEFRKSQLEEKRC